MAKRKITRIDYRVAPGGRHYLAFERDVDLLTTKIYYVTPASWLRFSNVIIHRLTEGHIRMRPTMIDTPGFVIERTSKND